MPRQKADGNLPFIDKSVKYVGVTKLRQMNAAVLSLMSGATVLQSNDKPLAVIVPYETFLRMQRLIDEGEER